ncbi:hypothetical protein U14_02169 [Candidatus Moduliflexus flocculans]|uniref:Uncharacterized protein n=1 Tax=Candidatus Moduliflexus flocculans TaxID=1499966 RepID=A0A0S6VXZ7_9BACT|nr:hypothetical protein U14_02169 [Candidatus Moduliflexus flocculans]
MKKEEHQRRIAIMIADRVREALRDCDELSELLEEARDDGYDVLLSIISGIIVRRRGADSAKEDDQPLPINFEFTDADKEFLQSIGIQVPVENV